MLPTAMLGYCAMVIVHSPLCLDYSDPGHPENPERVRSCVALLHKDYHTWLTPSPCADEDVLRVHTPAHFDAVKNGSFEDGDTPFFPNIFDIAKLSAGAAILAAEQSLAGQPAFSLMRPPGHHAERNRVMGFCYFNNVAIAVAKMLQTTRTVQRVAILDFDCHHGNGTEDIFRGNDRVLFASQHQSPCYPGTGLSSFDNCLNYPLAPGTGPGPFLAAVDDALAHLRDFKPDLLAVSAGFDAYKLDPIAQMGLEIETFHEIGKRIAAFTNPKPDSPKLPCFTVLEGGYSRDLPLCVEAFIHGWESH